MKSNYLRLESFIKKSFVAFAAVALIASGFFIPNLASADIVPAYGVTKITAVQTYAIADDTFEHGWRWVFEVTVPESETTLKMKFDNWFNGTDTILAQNNIRFYSIQSSNASSAINPITISDANTYSSAMNLTGDIDPILAGRQIQITVEVKVPVGKAGGSYSTSYGIHTWADQTISFPAIAAKIFGDAPFDLTTLASASSGLPVTFYLVSGPATLSGKVVTITGVGDIIVKASQAGNNNFNSANDVSQTIAVLKADPKVTWLNPSDITYPTALSDSQLNASAKGVDNQTLSGVFVYSPAAGATLSAGSSQTLSVTFTPTDTNDYNPVTQTVKINVLKADQTINWENPADITYGTLLSDTQLNATVSVSGATPAGVLTYSPVSGTKLNAGLSQTLTVTVAGTSDYNSATKSVSINVLKADQAVSFSALGDKHLGDSDFSVSATADSGLAVVFTANLSGVCTVSGSTVHIVGVGVCAITAQQIGDDNYNTATPVTQSFNVTDVIAPVAGNLTWSTVNHSSNNPVSPVENNYTIPTPLMGSDVFTSLSVSVTDLDLNKTDVPVFIDGLSEPNGVMHYSNGVWSYVPGTPVVFSDGTHDLVATFRDNSNNSLTLTAEFVVDREAPVIATHEDVTVNVSTNTASPATYVLPTVTDNHSTGLVAICLPVSGSTFAYGQTTVTCNAKDTAGNSATPTMFKVNVVDNVAPTITTYKISNVVISPKNGDGVKDSTSIDLAFSEESDYDISIMSGATVIVDWSGTAKDPGAKIWYGRNSKDNTMGTLVPDGIYTIKIVIKDAAKNTTTDTSKTIIVDNTPPAITSHADATVYVPTQIGTNVTYTLPAVTDADTSVVAICSPVSGTLFAYGDTTVKCDATDTAGNKATQTSFMVHVVDNVPPTLSVTGFTADGSDMAGNLTDGYTLNTEFVGLSHVLQFKTGSVANENLMASVSGLYLTPTAGQTDALVTYYHLTKPEPYLSYLDSAAAGTLPFAYIKTTGNTSVKLLDGAQYTLNGHNESDMIVPDDFPLGTYTVHGTIKDLAGNSTDVTFKLIVAGSKNVPVGTVTYDHDLTIPTQGPIVATLNVDPTVKVTSVGGLTHTFNSNDTFTFTFVSVGRTAGSAVATVSNIDTTAPTLTITGATDGGVDMTGDLSGGFVLNTNNVASVDHLVQFKSGTHADETLTGEYFGLKLIDSTVSHSDLKAYYVNRGVPEPFITYLEWPSPQISYTNLV